MNISILIDKKRKLEAFGSIPDSLKNNLDDWFSIELTYSSNAIEGNTLTRQETALIIEKGITVGGKSIKEHLEAINHVKAFNWIKDLIKKKHKTITEKDILNIHALILEGIDNLNAGSYRKVKVRIAGSLVVLPNPLKVPNLMEKFIKWLQNNKNLHPVELAAEAHYRLVTIHPFVDGNGRTARLLMNLILMMHGYPPAIIRKKDRLNYINFLEKARLGGSKKDYFKLIAKAIERSLDIYLQALYEKKNNIIFKDNNYRLLKIGELAKKVGESITTIRYWTKEKLLEVTEITKSGYQLYNLNMINRIKQIKKLKKQRYSLKEIKQKLNLK
ncbi:MAG: cell filamentation protein Fic [Chlamydiae bacterium SM23_39]|nr:MAG: cell filamentation protein Fic [Chlamydiae bacterium SM23_39]